MVPEEASNHVYKLLILLIIVEETLKYTNKTTNKLKIEAPFHANNFNFASFRSYL